MPTKPKEMVGTIKILAFKNIMKTSLMERMILVKNYSTILISVVTSACNHPTIQSQGKESFVTNGERVTITIGDYKIVSCSFIQAYCILL